MKIGFIAPYSEMADIARHMQHIGDVSLVIGEATYGQALSEMNKMVKAGVEVIISRGATSAYLKQYSDIPIIDCNYGVIDILYALKAAKQYGNKMGVVTYAPCHWLRAILEDLFQVELIFMDGYQSEKEIINIIRELKCIGVSIIIGGSVSVEIAEKYGMHGELIHTSAETIEQSVEEAKRVVNAIQKEYAELEMISKIIEKLNDAIILVDNEDKIMLMNPAAKAIFALGDSISSIGQLPVDREFLKGIRERRVRKGEIFTFNDVDMLVNQMPLIVGKNHHGVVLVLQKISAIQSLESKIRTHFLRKGFKAKYHVEDFLGESESARACREKVIRYGPLDSTVLILGESGTGKEILAQSIHNASRRKSGPFVAVNCSAISGSLLESELFGYEEGAFTGAKRGGKIGLFEQAHQGTIFLDEIGNISLEFQAGLLRVLQEKEIRRVGSDKVIPVDVRILAATNSNLLEEVKAGKFRLDLYYRLCVLELRVPSLRERREDVPILIKEFCKEFGKEYKNIFRGLERELESYDWPGNVRELRNFTERVCALSPEIPVHTLMNEQFLEESRYEKLRSDKSESYLVVKKGSLEEMEQDILMQIYLQCGQNKSLAADILKISRVTIWSKLGKKDHNFNKCSDKR